VNKTCSIEQICGFIEYNDLFRKYDPNPVNKSLDKNPTIIDNKDKENKL